MISYELAKKLNEAGFPKKEGECYFVHPLETKYKKGHFFEEDALKYIENGYEIFFVPTLSELIDEMPAKIKYRNVNGAYLMLSKLVPQGYRAYYEGLGGGEGEGVLNGLDFTDAYADAAVANLWLALNPKSP